MYILLPEGIGEGCSDSELFVVLFGSFSVSSVGFVVLLCVGSLLLVVGLVEIDVAPELMFFGGLVLLSVISVGSVEEPV